TLLGGFSTGNLQHNYNGLMYGLDGWIYMANGGNSGKPYWWGDTTTQIDLRGQDLRINFELKVMERLGASSGGFGLTMDEAGNVFETHNLHHISQLVFPGRYASSLNIPWERTLANISDHEENGLARIYPVGEQASRVNHPEQSGYFSGSCGITYYGGNHFGKEFEHTIWVADVVLNLIHVDKLIPENTRYSANRFYNKKEILASSDRSFRPVNMTVGPDGALYLVDLYRKVIEHPEWIPDELEQNMDLQAGKDEGRIYRIDLISNKRKDFDLNTLKSVEGQIASLGHPNQWVRTTAQRLLKEETLNDHQYDQLTKQLLSNSVFARLHSLWLLEIKQKLDDQSLLNALRDSNSMIKENALIISEKFLAGYEYIFKQCLLLLKDSDPKVRMQAALSLSTVSKEFFSKHYEILDALLISSTLTMDKWNISAISLAARHDPVNLFIRLIQQASTDGQMNLLESLALFSGAQLKDFKSVLISLRSTSIPYIEKKKIIEQASKNLAKDIKGVDLLSELTSLEQTDDIQLLTSLGTLRMKTGLPPSKSLFKYTQKAIDIVLDKKIPDSIRLLQMSLIDLMPFNEKSDILFKCINNKEPVSIQEASLKQLQKLNDSSIGPRLVQTWSSMGPFARRLAGDILLYKKMHQSSLLDGLEKGLINIGEMNFDLERRRTLLWWSDNDLIKKRAEALFTDVGVVNRKDAIEKMKPALQIKGSGEKGKKVFESLCSSCHTYGKIGNEVGPVLTEINRKSKETLIQDILDPNAATETKYISHKIELKNGEVHIGIIDAETDQSVTIKKMGGSKININKSDIREFISLGKSLMMEGLESNMTIQDMADLLSFLQSGKE
ncbi:MAG: PVC-type heme-binding CxxCH protein, partial [Saprospiraceae bacterium]